MKNFSLFPSIRKRLVLFFFLPKVAKFHDDPILTHTHTQRRVPDY